MTSGEDIGAARRMRARSEPGEPGGAVPWPRARADVRAWMRKASQGDLVRFLRAHPEGLALFSPMSGQVQARVLQVSAAGALRVRCTPGPDLRNPWGHVHGGVLLALMDEVGSAAAAVQAGPAAFGATTTLSASFIRPLRDAAFEILATGLGRSLGAMTVRVEVFDTDGTLHDAAIATFALRSPFTLAQGPGDEA